ncbi:hypothetical protein LSTR_LSTR004231 [Laodelphax striatellus]|uniref:Cyclin-like domain-containing protein n=1 Tax=Laodelphax striatellus TaxID=195883 RepID=A0A482XE15_LAOST|nr:hypothetical protein LSTR_LSTR004231 [Laodelphax striatellus]
MNLLCCERITPDSNFGYRDPVIFEEDRVLDNLLQEEDITIPSCNYFENVQKELKPFMRKVVVSWMLEVCEEQKCENQIFPLAINYLDRFLCVCPIKSTQLQILGAACLLVSSKVRQCHALSVDLLCDYTENSITPNDLLDWEMLLLSKLSWRLTAITGYDVMDHMIHRLPWSRDDVALRSHSLSMIAFCCIELDWMRCKPSLLASASLVAGASGLKLAATSDLISRVCHLSGSDPDQVHWIVMQLERMIAESVEITLKVPVRTDSNLPPNKMAAAPGDKMAAEEVLPSSDQQPSTPTDVQEVHF